MIITIVLIALCVIGLIFLLTCVQGKRYLKKVTTKDSCIVFGAKGSGKSIIFQEIANLNRYGYVSNTNFGRVYVPCKPKDISCSPNTWDDVLNGDIKPIVKNEQYERRPVLLDDASIYFPNFAEDKLKKLYASMPVAFALWRHFYDAPIHINTQDVQRTWKLLREQQSYFILARGVIKLPFGFLYVRYRFYDNIDTASHKIKPFKAQFGNKFARAEKDKFIATNGIVKNYHFIMHKKHIYYDSRYFHKVFFGNSITNKESRRLLKTTYRELKS